MDSALYLDLSKCIANSNGIITMYGNTINKHLCMVWQCNIKYTFAISYLATIGETL